MATLEQPGIDFARAHAAEIAGEFRWSLERQFGLIGEVDGDFIGVAEPAVLDEIETAVRDRLMTLTADDMLAKQIVGVRPTIDGVESLVSAHWLNNGPGRFTWRELSGMLAGRLALPVGVEAGDRLFWLLAHLKIAQAETRLNRRA